VTAIRIPKGKSLAAVAYSDFFPDADVGINGDGVASDFEAQPGWSAPLDPVWMDFLFSLGRTEGNYICRKRISANCVCVLRIVLSPEALDRLILVLLAEGHIHRTGDDDFLQVAARR